MKILEDFVIGKTKEEKDNQNGIWVVGTATSAAIDHDQERCFFIPTAWEAAVKEFFKGSEFTKGDKAPVWVSHGKSPEFKENVVGNVATFNYAPNDKEFKAEELAWWLDNAKVEAMSYITDPMAIELIKSKKLTGYSLSWQAASSKDILTTVDAFERGEDDPITLVYTKIHLRELTLTGSPANPEANNLVLTDGGIKRGKTVKVGEHFGQVKEVFVDEAGKLAYNIDFAENILTLEPIKAEFVKEVDNTKRVKGAITSILSSAMEKECVFGDKTGDERLEIQVKGKWRGYAVSFTLNEEGQLKNVVARQLKKVEPVAIKVLPSWEKMKEQNEVYSNLKEVVNMSKEEVASLLNDFKGTSFEKSIRQTISLIEKDKEAWGREDYEWAKNIIAFKKRVDNGDVKNPESLLKVRGVK